MRVLITGRGTSGSWQIRGVQLGEAIGATVERESPKPKGYDLCIIVKRAPPDLLHRIKVAKVPIVLDVVDGYPQPIGNTWDREQCLAWLRGQIASIKPVGIVAATAVMAKDCREFSLPVLTLPHHPRPGQRVNPIRERVQKVGYEGGNYLGMWDSFLRVECAARGWEWVINPAALADLDIVVAVREANGYAARSWKSNIKLANAQATGTPCIVNREAGYLETATGGELFADTTGEMVAALDKLADYETRKTAANGLWAPQLHVIAKTYREWLEQLKS